MLKLFRYLKIKEYILLVVLLIVLVGQIYCDVTMPIYTAEMVEKMQAGDSSRSILATGGNMLVFATVSIVLTVVQTFIAGFVSTTLAKRLRGKVYGKICSLSIKELNNFTTASLITRTTNDVQQVCSVLVLILRMGLGAPIMAAMAIWRIAQTSGELTLSTAIGVVILLVGIVVITFIVTPKFSLVQKLTDKLNGVTRENLTGIRVVRAFNAEGYEEQKFNEVNKKLTDTNLFMGRMTAALHPIISLVSYGVTLAIYWIGCYIIVRDNNAAFFPTMFSFTQLASQVIMAFMTLILLISWIPRAHISAKRVFEILDCSVSVEDANISSELTEKGTVEFKDVSFGYPESDGNIIENISFRAERGQTVAIIGATGCGKTTLLSLIERFFDCTEGEVLVDGVNVKNIPFSDLRKIIGYVPQKSVLFSGTIKDNVTFGNNDFTAEEVKFACENACAAEFIENLDAGYLSAVSQGGKNFSGGQKQRIAIARALIAKPQIFLFDDSFSALDYATDAKVRANLREYYKESTKIIVAQRISTVMDADKIVVIENGKAVGIGTHTELLHNCESYKKIALTQLSEEELAL